MDAAGVFAGVIAEPPWLGPGEAASAAQVELGVFLLIGLLGGAHCLGMCGPLVTVYADRMRTDGRTGAIGYYEVRQHALFNLGRTVSYAGLGAAFGLLGALVFDASALVTGVGTAVRAFTGVVVGVVILGVGARYLLASPGGHAVAAGGPLGRLFGRVSNRLSDWARGPRIVGLGLLHGILPCPLLYPAFLYAFARGSPTVGALGLGVLGLGTFPTLFCYGTLIGSVSATNRARLHRVLGAAFVLLGWIPLAHGLALLGIGVPHLEPPIYQPLA